MHHGKGHLKVVVAERNDQGASFDFHKFRKGVPDRGKGGVFHDPLNDGLGMVHDDVAVVLFGQGVDDVAVQDQGHFAVRPLLCDPTDVSCQLLGFAKNLKTGFTSHVEVGDDMNFVVVGEGHWSSPWNRGL
ncbi:MAG: hypothetical protein KKH60_02440 [Proteobacteria bacterium]|nr:hypothetical protein [Pseudomonadota bacterium]